MHAIQHGRRLLRCRPAHVAQAGTICVRSRSAARCDLPGQIPGHVVARRRPQVPDQSWPGTRMSTRSAVSGDPGLIRLARWTFRLERRAGSAVRLVHRRRPHPGGGNLCPAETEIRTVPGSACPTKRFSLTFGRTRVAARRCALPRELVADRSGQKACSWRRCRSSPDWTNRLQSWATCEAKLKRVAAVQDRVDGLDIAFIHVKIPSTRTHCR